MTICNAGAIATARYGTALAPFHLAKEKGMTLHAYACETRPVLQGARLTAWELSQAGVDVTLITDNMAAQTMKAKRISAVIVGADRIAANGDTANKIGTFGLAILAKAFNIPFYVAAPLSTIDLQTKTGDDIPIEERAKEEVTHIGGVRIAPNVNVYNPAFDVTPHELITGIITEKASFWRLRNKTTDIIWGGFRMRNLWLAFVLLLVLLAGCTNEQDAVSKPAQQPKEETKQTNETTGADIPAALNKPIKIAAIMQMSIGTFSSQYIAGVKEQVAKFGGDVQIYNADNDLTKMASYVETAINQNVDAILLDHGRADALKAPVEKALAKGIHVVAFDNDLNIPGVTVIDQDDYSLAWKTLKR